MLISGVYRQFSTAALPRSVMFWLVVALRIACLVFVLCSIDSMTDLGTSPLLLSLFIGSGAVMGSVLAFSNLRTRGVVLLCLSLWILFYAIGLISGYIPSDAEAAMSLWAAMQHLRFSLSCLLIGLLSTYFFWRYRHTITFEVLLIGLTSIYLLSGHRNYRLDSPQWVSSLAWQIGIEPQSMLIVLGGSIVTVLLLFTAFWISPTPATAGHKEAITLQLNRTRLLGLATVFAAVLALISAVGMVIYRGYDVDKGKLSNGVGEAGKSGSSPLGFHSALGSSNQPAALVRLEGDYPNNPFGAMLFLRESALSEFNGRELVIAGPQYDPDVNGSLPTEVYTAPEDKALSNRVSVVQSVYLLAEQEPAFALDYPVEIRQLTNPDASRFVHAYRAYSLAPSFELQSILHSEVGDARWSDSVKKHYLEQHPDPRYAEFAENLTRDAVSPIEKAALLQQYLVANAIYTLSPGHDVEPEDDPVAPFLFGDKRGYCVHFAHAMTYMLRALGVPARVGTGYLTDLSQSKDGHILLRMSDRHAWAEVYVQKKGWLPFDVQPEKVESHADSAVDMELLEELMSKLEPGEEILPESTLEGEENVYQTPAIYIPSIAEISIALGVVLILFVGLKLFLVFGWYLTASSDSALRRAYISLASQLLDLGFPRHVGETRTEYRERLKRQYGLEMSAMINALNEAKYGTKADLGLSLSDVRAMQRSDKQLLKDFPWWKRVLAFLSPASLVRGLLYSRW